MNAQDRIPWVADFGTACGMAAEQRRLVLLHFYNDNCGPCVRVDQNVFSKPEVAEAVSQSYVAVKVQREKIRNSRRSITSTNGRPTFLSPLLASKSFAPSARQNPTDYIAVLNQVAAQAGIGGGRQANNPLNALAQTDPNAQAVGAAAAAGLTGAFAAAEQRAQQTTADAQRATAEAQQKWNATAQQTQNTVNQAHSHDHEHLSTGRHNRHSGPTAARRGRSTTSDRNATAAVQQVEQQATAAVQQTTNTAKQWENQAASAVQGYEQQATTAYQQARDRATQVGQQAEATKQQWQTTASQTAQEVNTAAQNLKQQASAVGSSLLDRRSAFMPVETSPAAAATAPSAPPVQASPRRSVTQPQPGPRVCQLLLQRIQPWQPPHRPRLPPYRKSKQRLPQRLRRLP